MLRRVSRAEFERVMLPHMQASYNLARWILQNPNDAEDAVQEAYLKAYRGFDDYAGGSSAGWLLKIVRNTCLYMLRRKAGKPKVVSIDVAAARLDRNCHDALLDTTATQPDVALIEEDERHTVREAVRELPQPFREIVILREFEGLSYREIAQVTGIPIGTVMSRLSRARRTLLDTLSDALARGGNGHS